jgi:hypothetical protein
MGVAVGARELPGSMISSFINGLSTSMGLELWVIVCCGPPAVASFVSELFWYR